MGKWAHDEQEVEALWSNYQPLIFATMKRFQIHSCWDDAYQEASLAFMEAWRRYEPEKGSFGAYLKRYIQGYLLKWLQREQAWSDYRSIYQREGEDDEEWHTRALQMASYDEAPIDILPYYEGLSPKEALFVHKVWGEGMKLVELATFYGVSPKTVQTWGRRAKKKIKHRLSASEE